MIFPKREPPRVVEFNLKKTYGRLLEMVEQAFNKTKPLFSLAIYYPLAYYKGPDTTIDPLKHGRQKEVVSLIRIQFLKRSVRICTRAAVGPAEKFVRPYQRSDLVSEELAICES